MQIYRTVLTLALILVVQAVLFQPYLSEPFERDEGAYAYIAQRLSSGELPYRDSYDHKPPMIYFIYASVFKFFGTSMAAIRSFTLLVSLLTTLAVFFLAWLILGRFGAIVSALLYAFYAGNPYIQGTSANTETFMVLPMVLSLAFFLLALRREQKLGWLFLAGLCSGLAVMIKQVALLNFLVILGYYVFICLRQRKDWSGVAALLIGLAVVPMLTVGYFFLKDAWSALLHGYLLENLLYVSRKVWVWPRLWLVLQELGLLWGLSALAIMLIWFNEKEDKFKIILAWALASGLGVFMGRAFYGHYFIQVVPALAILAGYSLLKIAGSNWRLVLLAFLALIFSMDLFSRISFGLLSPELISQKKYGINNFVVAGQVAEFIKQKTLPKDRLFIWGAEPEVYFYSQRAAASHYIYYYPLLYKDKKSQQARLALLTELKEAPPEYIIWVEPRVVYGPLLNYVKAGYNYLASFGRWQIWRRKRIK